MSIYVDPLRPCVPTKKWPYNQSCHLVADSSSMDDLHTLAERIGLKRSWFQNHPLLPHYDLTAGKRKEAILAGAIWAYSGKEGRMNIPLWLFPSIIVSLNILSAIVYLKNKDYNRGIYWIAAAVLTITVTTRQQ